MVHTAFPLNLFRGEHLHGNIKVQEKAVAMYSAKTSYKKTGERLVKSN